MKEKFESASFLVELEHAADCKVSVKVTIKPEESERAYKKAVKLINKQISIPGFRKGKAPDAAVVSRHPAYIEKEWKQELVAVGVQGAFDLSQTYPMFKELLEKPKLIQCERETGGAMTFAYERYPAVPEIQFTDIQLPEIALPSITEEQVAEVLTEVRRAHATYEPLDREIQVGDSAQITVKHAETGNVMADKRRVTIEEKYLGKWLLDLLLGMKKEEMKEGKSDGTPELPVQVTVHEVQQIILPEVNDELAKKVGASSVDDLMEKIRQNLKNEAEADQRLKQIEALEKALLERYVFDLPGSLKEKERERRLKWRLEELRETESDEAIHAREHEIEAEVAAQVDRSLRLYFLERQIAKQGKLELTQAEVNGELAKQIMRNPYAFQNKMDQAATERMIAQVSETLMERKIKDYALSAVLTN